MPARAIDRSHLPSAKEAQNGTRLPSWAKGLSAREYAFVSQYLLDLNATAACLRAGIGTTQNSAANMGHVLFNTPHVRAAIDAAITKDAAGPRLWLINRLGAIADASIDAVLEWAPNSRRLVLKCGKDVPPEMRKLVKKVRMKANGDTEIELHDPLRAAEILAKFTVIGGIKPEGGGETALDQIIAASMRIGREQAEEIYRRQISGPVIEGECKPVEVKADE